MKVYVSQTYLNWIDSRRSDKKAINAFDRFLKSVHNAKSAAEAPKPKNRENCTTKGGIDGTVSAYEIARKYRLYADLKVPTGDTDVAFYAATAMHKNNEKSQGDDIGVAITMFNSFNSAEWVLWEPSNTPVESNSDEEVDTPDEVIEEAKPIKKKGKPVDANGLTVAERKALRKKEQEEKQRQQQQQKQADAQKRKAAAQKAKAEASAQKPAAAEDVVTPKATTPKVDTPTPTSGRVVTFAVEDVPNHIADNNVVTDDDVATPKDAEPKAEASKPSVGRIITFAEADHAAVAKSSVTLNGVATPEINFITGEVRFRDYTDVEYQLELIEREIAIEKLNIQMIQHKLALEELAIKKLRLLQAQKIKDMQK